MQSTSNPFSDDAENPYRATTLDATANPVSMGGPEGIRREHIKHEASVKSVGTLYILGSTFLTLACVGIVIAGVSGQMGAQELGIMVGMGSFYAVLAGVQGFTGYGLWKLKPWSRWIAVAFSALGLLVVPIGTLISAYILYLLLSEKGKMVFSEPYQHIIAQTPHVKYKTSIVAWIVLFIVLALLGAIIVFAFVG